MPGYPTTWGSNAFKDQVIETEATVVRLLREAGAVMLAKLATGELAGGDRWFGGRTNSPWGAQGGVATPDRKVPRAAIPAPRVPSWSMTLQRQLVMSMSAAWGGWREYAVSC